MNFQEIVDNAITVARYNRMKTSNQVTLGELIILLEKIPNKKLKVEFDSETYPLKLSSWRGSYAEIAFEYEELENGIPPNLKELISDVKGAIGKTYEGYKGGDFLMGKNTPVWVSKYGCAENTGIVDVIYQDDKVVIKTAEFEY